MEKTKASVVIAVVILPLFLLTVLADIARAGENIVYDGTNPPLQTSPLWAGNIADSLFPGATAAPGSSDNTVSIDFTAGTNPNNVFGGYSWSGSALYNSIVMSDGTVDRDIYGGYIAFGLGSATHNIVNLHSGVRLDAANSELYGGFSFGSGDAFTGNTLNLYGWQGGLHSLNNFENINFYLPATLANGGTLINSAIPSDIASANIKVYFPQVGIPLAAGKSIILIDNTSGVLANSSASGMKGFPSFMTLSSPPTAA